MVSDRFTLPWLEGLRELVPELALFDAHTHIGQHDPDGFRCSAEELTGALAVGQARAAVFPMHEPDGYPAANDMVLAEAEGSDGRLVAFCRLDPEAGPLREAERCLDAGVRGIKLHPRAEQFSLNHPALRDVFALANERRLPVICHAGRGIPALGRHAVDLCAEFPHARLILAHAGICDLAWIWHEAAERPNLFFDTAWWSASDLLTLFTHVPPGQVLFGSDAPYATPVYGAVTTLRYALQAGLDGEQARAVAGGQLERLLAGEEPVDLGPAPGIGRLDADPLLERPYTFLVSAIGQALRGYEPEESLQLAALACEVGEATPRAPIFSSILAMIEARKAHIEAGDEGRPAHFAPGLHLIVMAACLARTPDVPLPPDPGPHADVAEREAAQG